MTAADITERHVRRFFRGHAVEQKRWTPGPGTRALPDLEVLEIGPGPRLNRWTYVTAGASDAGLRRLEYLAIGDAPRDTYVELLTMVAYYAIEQRLGLGHTIPIGRPLIEGSVCEHVYLSLPYLFGPKFEVIERAPESRQILWVFPITADEKRLLLDSGLDALEERLESRNVEYWSPYRKSVV